MKYYALLFLFASFSCGTRSSDRNEPTSGLDVDEHEFTAAPAPEWSDLFVRKSGWFGGDGIFAIPFSGSDYEQQDSVLFLFSDTMIGQIEGNKLKPGFSLVNNSVAVLKGKKPDSTGLTFRMAGEAGHYRAIFRPNAHKPDKDTYFWLGDGFVNRDAGKDLFIFSYQITNTHDNSALPFKETGNSLIRIPAGSHFPYTDQQQFDLPFNDYKSGGETISFGSAVFNNSSSAEQAGPDGFVYVYGTKGADKKLVSARVTPARVTAFNEWEFWNGTGWTKDVKSVATLADSVSNELSVSLLAPGKYALVYQLGGLFSDICMQVGPTPVGPFGPRIVLYKTSADIKDPDLFTYNAKAHPALSAPGELLISYNVNTFKFFEILEKQPNMYRPRFVRVKFKSRSDSQPGRAE
ncbi:hypothetical protein GCM10007423_21260 [Dyadobacter endophyticus]|uniref:DUF4185 domain-containing protein n=1 Tax=Dyadobacter endophyticus TaxID=1749036 RepID=A0ABQ1YPI9_9BACT|nr:DUF4185 domain-containing protein [Dyadobacter endophyticus]GGH32003.1 hypothetical protein GCM10007423_21260 [Dyadobacter endophyticus]